MSKAAKNVDAFSATLQAGLQSRGRGAQLPAQTANETAMDVAPEQRLADLEQLITSSTERFTATVKQAQQRHRHELGQALKSVRDEELYVLAGYDSFGRYVEGRWGWKRQHAYRLIDMVPVRAALAPLGAVDELTESQARVLAQVGREHDDDAVRKVWQHVQDQDGQKVTAARLTAAREALGLVPDEEVSPIGDTDEVIDAEIVEDDDAAELVNQDLKAAADSAERALGRLSAALERGVAPADPAAAAVALSRLRTASLRLGKKAAAPPGAADA